MRQRDKIRAFPGKPCNVPVGVILTECFRNLLAHTVIHFSSGPVRALERKPVMHSEKQRSTSPLNMRSVSFTCMSSSLSSISVLGERGSVSGGRERAAWHGWRQGAGGLARLAAGSRWISTASGRE
eukprot:scaffold106770_cov37-Tisochrysis_lutea.AAC.1